VTLFYISGYSMAEVAEICDASVAKVKSRLHEARQRLKEEMVHMVEDVLKTEAPREGFAQRVFAAITGRISWEARDQTLKEIGQRGIEGFVQALQSGDWRHRRNAVQFEDRLRGPQSRETIIEMLKRALADRNKKVRGGGVAGLMQMDVPAERKVREFLPLVVPMLDDRSARVRRTTASYLLEYAAHVPADLAARAYFGEKRPTRQWPLAELLKKAAKATNK
jgi:HEAT repeat protein